MHLFKVNCFGFRNNQAVGKYMYETVFKRHQHLMHCDKVNELVRRLFKHNIPYYTRLVFLRIFIVKTLVAFEFLSKFCRCRKMCFEI